MTFEKNIIIRKLKLYIGDVRDSQSVETAMRDVDYVFHAAAEQRECRHVNSFQLRQ